MIQAEAAAVAAEATQVRPAGRTAVQAENSE